MSYGFVYVLGNDSMSGIYKIGRTEKAPMERMDQLSAATACPTPFWLAMFAQVKSPFICERAIHEILSEARVNRSREFFKIDLDSISIAVSEGCCGEIHWTMDGQVKRWHEDEDIIRDKKLRHFFNQNADPTEWRNRGFK